MTWFLKTKSQVYFFTILINLVATDFFFFLVHFYLSPMLVGSCQLDTKPDLGGKASVRLVCRQAVGLITGCERAQPTVGGAIPGDPGLCKKAGCASCGEQAGKEHSRVPGLVLKN